MQPCRGSGQGERPEESCEEDGILDRVVDLLHRVDEGAAVAELANRLGYRSEAAFARAFKRVVGVAPGSVKRNAGVDDLVAGGG